MSDVLSAPCLVVGPRRAGRDYDLLAASAGLQPAVADLGRVKRHNFEVRAFVRPDRPVHAFFRLPATGADVWMLATTSLNGEIGGNPVWITTGLVLTPDLLDAVDGRVLPLALPWPGAEPPPPGAVLAPIAVGAPGPLEPIDPMVVGWAERLGRARLAIEAPSGAVDGVLAAVLDAAPAWRRRNLAFISAPPEAASPDDAPALAVFEAGTRRAGAPVGYELIQLDALEPGGARASAPRSPWDDLLEAAARARFGLARGLDVAARALPLPPAETGEAETQRRVDAYLETETSDAARLDALFHLVRSARAITDEAGRAETLRALLKTFEKRMKAAVDPIAWLDTYLDRIEPVIGADGPRLLPARLAIETGVLFSLDRQRAERLAPAVCESLLEAAQARLAGGVAVAAPALDALLAAVVRRLDIAPRDTAPPRFGNGLVTALARAGGEGGDTVAAFLHRLIGSGRRDALAALRESGALPAFKRSGGAPISAELRQALSRARGGDFRQRDQLASALSVWRLGKAWDAA